MRLVRYKPQPTAPDLMGAVSGRLRVVAKAPSLPAGARWLCRCDPALGGCGREVTVFASNLRAGNPTRSCGCAHKLAGTAGWPEPVYLLARRLGWSTQLVRKRVAWGWSYERTVRVLSAACGWCGRPACCEDEEGDPVCGAAPCNPAAARGGPAAHNRRRTTAVAGAA